MTEPSIAVQFNWYRIFDESLSKLLIVTYSYPFNDMLRNIVLKVSGIVFFFFKAYRALKIENISFYECGK